MAVNGGLLPIYQYVSHKAGSAIYTTYTPSQERKTAIIDNHLQYKKERMRMKVYRVCNKIEADYQTIGQPWQSPPFELKTVGHTDKSVIYTSLFPEYWRRKFNEEINILGKVDTVYYDHTLLLEVPDDVEERKIHRYLGMEYMVPYDQAIVRGVAGPEWPLPDWCPQPPDKSQWQPTSPYWSDVYWRWKPCDGTTIPWRFRQTQPELNEQMNSDIRDIMRFALLGIRPEPKDMTPVTEQDLYQVEDIQRILKDDFPSRTFLERYRIDPAWFKRPASINGIHGISHMARVLVWQEVIARLYLHTDAYPLNQEALRWAAVTHDTQRIDDGHDPEHGQRAALWVGEHFKDMIEETTLNNVQYLNHWHVPLDRTQDRIYSMVALFKDADGLDRVRFNGLNTHYLRNFHTKAVVPLAYKLHEHSEQKHRDGMDPFDSVLAAAVEMGLVQDV
jgi:hypothetical protein